MKRVAILLALAVCIAAATTLAAQEKKYGSGVALKEATSIEALLAQPDKYLGKTVRVDGIVTGVCDMAGCWMEMRDTKADAKTAKTLRFKVDDGVIVFPQEARGKRASAEGVVEAVSAAMAQEYAADAKKMAQKPGAKEPTAAPPQYQVKATGAVIW